MAEGGGRDRDIYLKWIEDLKRRRSFPPGTLPALFGTPVIFRVHSTLRELKSECFDSTSIALGLFGLFDILKKAKRTDTEIPMRKGDAIKMDMAKIFLGEIGETLDNWDSIIKELVKNPREMMKRYHGHWDFNVYEDHVRSALALDAIFLASLLAYEYYPASMSSTQREADDLFEAIDSRTRKSLLGDLFILENQIPLSLVKNVIGMRLRYQTAPHSKAQQQSIGADPSFKEMCGKVWNEMCRNMIEEWRNHFPSIVLTSEIEGKFACREDEESSFGREIEFNECHHLLHCQAKVLWEAAEESARLRSVSGEKTNGQRNARAWSLQMRVPRKECSSRSRGDQYLARQILPSAMELQRYGIKFEGQDEFFPSFKRRNVWLATLYLPRVRLTTDYTERLWRNFLAYEDAYGHGTSKNSFRSYLALMDQLINTAEDVALLSQGNSRGRNPVITFNGLGDHRAVAKLFNGILENHTVPSDPQWHALTEEVISFHRRSVWRYIAKFISVYGETPWLFFSAIAAVILLLLTVAQTLFTIHQFG